MRALGLAVGGAGPGLVQPGRPGPLRAGRGSTTRWPPWSREAGGAVEGAELVGLIPAAVLAAVAPGRRAELGLSEDATVEARLPPDVNA